MTSNGCIQTIQLSTSLKKNVIIWGKMHTISKTIITMKKKNKSKALNLDAIKAMKRGEREAQMELFGPGFHSFNRTHKSKKTYTRKLKHKPTADTD